MPAPERTVFLRDSSGLVREMSTWHALIGNILICNLVIGSVSLLWSPYSFPGGNLPIAVLIAWPLTLLLAIVYVLFAITMPRSGGDYIYISRTLHPAIGFAANFNLVAWNMIWIGTYSNWVSTVGLSGMFVAMGSVTGSQGLVDLGNTISTPAVTYIIATVVNVLMGILLISGLRRALNVQAILFAISIVGVALAILIVGVNSRADFVAAFNAASPLDYDQVIATSQANNGPTVERWADVANTWFATGWVALSLFFVQFSQYAGGEAKDVRRNVPIAIIGSHTFAAAMLLIMALVMMKTWGFDFLAAIYHLYDQGIEYPFSIEPTFTLLSAMLTGSPVLIFIIGLGFTMWSVAAIIFNHLANSRCVLAWTMDRVLPAKLGDVSDRYHTPVPAIVLSVVAAQIWLTYYSFAGDRLEFLGGTTLGYMVGFLFTAIAAVVFPYWRKELYDASPARITVFGAPLITLVGIGTIVYFITLMYGFLTNDALLANAPRGLVFMAGLWVLGLVIFYVNKLVRRSQGVDVDLAYRAIPPE